MAFGRSCSRIGIVAAIIVVALAPSTAPAQPADEHVVASLAQVLSCSPCALSTSAVPKLTGGFDLPAGSEQGTDDGEWTIISILGRLTMHGVGVGYLKVEVNGQPALLIQVKRPSGASTYEIQIVTALTKKLMDSDSGGFDIGEDNYPIYGSTRGGHNDLSVELDGRLIESGQLSLDLDANASAVKRTTLPPYRLAVAQATLVPGDDPTNQTAVDLVVKNSGPAPATAVAVTVTSETDQILASGVAPTIGAGQAAQLHLPLDPQPRSATGQVRLRFHLLGTEQFAHGSTDLVFRTPSGSPPAKGRSSTQLQDWLAVASIVVGLGFLGAAAGAALSRSKRVTRTDLHPSGPAPDEGGRGS